MNTNRERLKKLAEEYWLRKLEGIGDQPPLFNDSSRSSNQKTGEHETLSISIPMEITYKMNRLYTGKKSNATKFLVYLSVLKILYYRYTGYPDVVIGSSHIKFPGLAHNPGHIDPLIFFRSSLAGGLSFKDIIRQEQAILLEVLGNQDYDYNRFLSRYRLNDLGEERCLYYLGFYYNRLNCTRARLDHFDVSVCIDEPGPGDEQAVTELGINFPKGIDTIIIRCFLENYVFVLTHLLEHKTVKLKDINVLSPYENSLLETCNAEAVAFPVRETVLDLFLRQVKKNPDRIAVIGSTQITAVNAQMSTEAVNEAADQVRCSLTYKELNRRSNQLARLLKAKGAKPGTIVAIMMDRSLEMIIAILAILKTGGAYLPIDIQYPQNRKIYMLADSRVKLILSNYHKKNTREYIPNHIEILDLRDKNIYKEDCCPPPGIVSTNPLYVIYTSGSTGKPKGVILEHRNLVNLLMYQLQYTNINCRSILQFATISFDASSHEIFSALGSGGELVLIDEETRTNIPALMQLIEISDIKTLFLPMSLLKVIFGHDDYIRFFPGCVRHIQTAGEQVVVNEAFRTYLQQRSVYLHNHYGPSETHVVTTLTLDPKGEIPQLPCIGKPVANTVIYIMDRCENPQPLGVAGELYARGTQVGRGYLNNPELTSEKFLTVKTKTPEEKNMSHRFHRSYIYRTGDLARRLPHGNIEFLGRLDHQIKIRGFRVELGEIESHLLNHHDIDAALVLAREDNTGDKYLCAYIVSGKKLDEPGLRDYLANILPAYMIPSFFVVLEKLPLTPNRKIDRNALPAPNFKLRTPYVAPRDKLEEKLAGIWSEILGNEGGLEPASPGQSPPAIGIDDHFFQMGGHSLKATILLSRIHKEFNVKAYLGQLFKQPTIRGLSKLIKGAMAHMYAAIKPVEKKEFYEISSAQKRLYIIQQMKPSSTAYNIRNVISLEHEPDLEELENTFKQLIKRHEPFRTAFRIIDGSPKQVIHGKVEFKIQYFFATEERRGGNYKLQITNNKERNTRAQYLPPGSREPIVESLIHSFIRPFDLEKPPLLRVGLIKPLHTPAAHPGHPFQQGKEKEDKYLLIIDMHHIISDAVSQHVLLEDFKKINKQEVLSAVRLQYKDFTLWQNCFFQSREIKKQEKYWLEEFFGKLPTLDMPLDYPRSTKTTSAGALLHFQMDRSLTRQLKELAKETETTLFMILLAAYNVLLSKCAKQDDIIVGVPIAGRPHSDLENVVGMFANTLALRNYPRGDLTFRKFLENVKEKSLKAFENQDYQFDMLVAALGLKREQGRNPLFDVVFNFGPGYRQVEIEKDKAKPSYAPHYQTATFDFSLRGVEGKDAVSFTLNYSTTLFKQETAQRLKQHFFNILEKVVENPEVVLSDIDMLSQQEKNKVLVEFSHANEEDDYEFE